MHRIERDLLGRFRLAKDNREIRLPAGKALLLLAFLACARSRTARRDRLASLFWQNSDVEQARGSLRQTLSLMSRLTAAGPLLLIAEDHHWADTEDVQRLIDLVHLQSESPLLMVATERRVTESFAHTVQSQVVQVDVLSFGLTPLSRQQTKALLKSMVSDEAIQQRILDRAGGHPLYLTQLAEFGFDLDATVSVSVLAVVQGELDRISSRARDASMKASILGMEFNLSTVESLFPEIDLADLYNSRASAPLGRNSFSVN